MGGAIGSASPLCLAYVERSLRTLWLQVWRRGDVCSVMSPVVSGVVGWGCYWCDVGVMIAMKSDVCDGSA